MTSIQQFEIDGQKVWVEVADVSVSTPSPGKERFANTSALIISALLLGLANAVLWPLLVLLTLPLTFLTLGFFLLVINALMLLLVARLVRGFTVSGFWTALFASLFVSVFSLFLNSLMPDAEMAVYRLPPAGRTISM